MITPEILKAFCNHIEKDAYDLKSSKGQFNKSVNRGIIRGGVGAMLGTALGGLRGGRMAAIGAGVGAALGYGSAVPRMLKTNRVYQQRRTMAKTAEKMSDVSRGSNVLQMEKKVKTKMPGKEKKPAVVPTEV